MPPPPLHPLGILINALDIYGMCFARLSAHKGGYFGVCYIITAVHWWKMENTGNSNLCIFMPYVGIHLNN